MAREILFRAKEIKTNKWVYGYYTKGFRSAERILEDNIYNFDNDFEYYIVDPETVGQYTGRKDKNGTKIFEGDIVEFETNVNCIASELKPYWKDCIEKQCTLGCGTWWVRKDQAVVQWNSKDGMWDLKVYNNGRYKRKSKLFTYRESDYVVIGNIYDNPELLEGNDA